MYDKNTHNEEIRFLRTKQVLELVALSRTTIYRLSHKGEFPKPVRIGSASVWCESEIKSWMKERLIDR